MVSTVASFSTPCILFFFNFQKCNFTFLVQLELKLNRWRSSRVSLSQRPVHRRTAVTWCCGVTYSWHYLHVLRIGLGLWRIFRSFIRCHHRKGRTSFLKHWQLAKYRILERRRLQHRTYWLGPVSSLKIRLDPLMPKVFLNRMARCANLSHLRLFCIFYYL